MHRLELYFNDLKELFLKKCGQLEARGVLPEAEVIRLEDLFRELIFIKKMLDKDIID